MGKSAAVNDSARLVVFTLDEQRYGLPLAVVERIVRAVEITPLPKAPPIVAGVINVQGRVVPVVSLRRRFGLLEREIDLSDQFVIARTARRWVALVVDAATGVVEVPAEKIVAAEKVLPHLEYIAGLAKLEDNLILIHDLDAVLSLDEENALDAALRNEQVFRHPKDQPG